ncbi:MAG: hypothetical protein ABR986_02170 [Methanomassiliicoccales archaeon]|jgi:hypothetical protein
MEFTKRHLLILLTVVIPLILLVLAMAFNAGICIFLAILTWIGIALVMIYMPQFKE